MIERCIIYIIKNTINTKVYIGQTWQTCEKRWKQGYSRQAHMNSAIKKYGKDKFYYEEIMLCFNQEDADYFERYFIQKYKSNNRKYGYNLAEGGKSGGKPSKETKKKMSIARKGKPGRKQSKEIRNKISKTLAGRKLSEATKEKISIANSGSNHPNFGKQLSDDIKNKISEAVSGENHPFFGKRHNETSLELMQTNAATRKLNTEDVVNIRTLHSNGMTQKDISEIYNVSKGTINDIIKRRSWKNI